VDDVCRATAALGVEPVSGSSGRRYYPHRNAGTDKQAKREDARADDYPEHRQFIVGTRLRHGRQCEEDGMERRAAGLGANEAFGLAATLRSQT
jgi:hypothetical protein